MAFVCAATRRHRPRTEGGKILTRVRHWKEELVADKDKYWGPGPVRLSVAFLDLTSEENGLESRILSCMNRWSDHADVRFSLEPDAGRATIRVARRSGEGYWSDIGRDCELAKAGEATMNLEGITLETSDAELERAVVHEAGHCLGFEHEHLRAEVVQNLDKQVVYIWFGVRTGWSRERIERELLTPLEEASGLSSPEFDNRSVMCYFIPSIACLDGKEVPGGKEIDFIDAQFVGELYPRGGSRT